MTSFNKKAHAKLNECKESIAVKLRFLQIRYSMDQDCEGWDYDVNVLRHACFMWITSRDFEDMDQR